MVRRQQPPGRPAGPTLGRLECSAPAAAWLLGQAPHPRGEAPSAERLTAALLGLALIVMVATLALAVIWLTSRVTRQLTARQGGPTRSRWRPARHDDWADKPLGDSPPSEGPASRIS